MCLKLLMTATCRTLSYMNLMLNVDRHRVLYFLLVEPSTAT